MARTAIAVQQVAKNSGAQLTSVTPDQPSTATSCRTTATPN
jgi:hypothetical protein